MSAGPRKGGRSGLTEHSVRRLEPAAHGDGVYPDIGDSSWLAIHRTASGRIQDGTAVGDVHSHRIGCLFLGRWQPGPRSPNMEMMKDCMVLCAAATRDVSCAEHFQPGYYEAHSLWECLSEMYMGNPKYTVFVPFRQKFRTIAGNKDRRSRMLRR